MLQCIAAHAVGNDILLTVLHVCRLSDYPYLNVDTFPCDTVEQCYSFHNQMGGHMCNINGCAFGEYCKLCACAPRLLHGGL